MQTYCKSASLLRLGVSGPGVPTGVSRESYYTNMQLDGTRKPDPAAQGLNGRNLAR